MFSLSLSELVKVYLWKLNNLLQLTLGMWSKEVIDNYRISAISEAYHVSHPGDDEPEVMAETNMSILNLVGETYTMIYYFFPPLVALAQLGAASTCLRFTYQKRVPGRPLLLAQQEEGGYALHRSLQR